MNSELWERESDTLLIECIVYYLVHVEINIPVIGRLRPYTHLDVYTACRKSSQGFTKSKEVH